MSELIKVGTCPKCGHFPTQFIATDTGILAALHLAPTGEDDPAVASARRAIVGGDIVEGPEVCCVEQ